MPFSRRGLFWKGTLFIVLSSLAVLSVYGVFLSVYISRALLRKTQDNGVFILEAVRNGLFQSMAHQDRQILGGLIKDIARHGDIRVVVVYNNHGELTVSSVPGRGLSKDIRLLTSGSITPMVTQLREGGVHTMAMTRILLNEPACYGCHPPENAKLGAVGVELSMENYDRFNAQKRTILLLMAAGLIVILMVANLAFFTRRVVWPLKGLSFKVKEIENGIEDVKFGQTGGDEISELERSFGVMVRRLRDQHQAEVEKEKEMALMVQDLKHQMEIAAVNRQLENRLMDLDQANRKIGKLATSLDEKNINLGKAVKRITALNRLGVALTAELEMDKLIRLVVNVAVKGLRAERGFLMLLDEEVQKLTLAYGMGLGEEYDRSVPVEVGDSISGLVAARGEPILIEDMSRETKFRRVSRFGFLRKSVICTPLKVKDRNLGTIELTNKKGEENFTTEDLEMLSSISAQAAIAIDNAKLYQKIQKSYLETIRALIQAVEEKDRYTRGHSERVTIFSLKIAQKLGLDQRQLDIIKYAGYLHDIGKIGIDINILQKKGKLDAAEYDLVKNHPLIGERIIAPIEFLKNVRGCISQHHERYDGFGYPLGIKGTDMGLEARILSVADAYDAMITDRPYRRAMSKDRALAELRRCSGTQFDPEVVEAFIEVLQTDLEIRALEKSLSAVGT